MNIKIPERSHVFVGSILFIAWFAAARRRCPRDAYDAIRKFRRTPAACGSSGVRSARGSAVGTTRGRFARDIAWTLSWTVSAATAAARHSHTVISRSPGSPSTASSVPPLCRPGCRTPY